MVFWSSLELMSKFYTNNYIPPIIKFLFTPIIFIWWIIALIIYFFLWLLGFWICSECEKTFSFLSKSELYYNWQGVEHKCCLECYKEMEEQ